MLEPNLNDGEVYVAGRGEKKARELFALAEQKDIDVSLISATSHGFIVPEGLLDDDTDAVRKSDQPAVATEPGTTTDPQEAWNAEAWKAEQEEILAHATVDDANEILVKPVEDAQAQAEAQNEQFNPANHTVPEVKAYYDQTTDEERARVIEAEKASEKPRTGVLSLADEEEGDK